MNTQVAAATAAPLVVTTTVPNAHPTPIVVQMPPQTAPQSLTWFQAHLGWLTHGIAGVFLIAAVSLIVLLAIQTTKQEGLSGSIGGRVESAYRGRLGADEQLKRITGMVAVAFVVTAFVLSITGI